MAGEEKHEHVARLHLGAEIGEHLVEIGHRHVAVEHGLDLDRGIKPGAGPPEGIGYRRCIRYRISQMQPAVVVIVDSNREHIELWRTGGLRAVPFEGDFSWL